MQWSICRCMLLCERGKEWLDIIIIPDLHTYQLYPRRPSLIRDLEDEDSEYLELVVSYGEVNLGTAKG